MEYVTTVRVLVKETRQPLAGITVGLYDRDERSPDDPLGRAPTNQFGEVMFRYHTKNFADGPFGSDDGGVGPAGRDTVPDLFVILYDALGKEIVSTRETATQNSAPEHLLVLVDAELATRHGLLTE
jgi:hypothetical protein